jgi:hypothetical protein
MGNAREWALEIDAQWAEQMGGLKRAVVFVAVEGLYKVQGRSPVKTGQFRDNWLHSVGGPDVTVQEGPGSALAAKSSRALAAYPDTTFPSIWLQNNLPYAEPLEDGYSSQAPGGVLGVTVPELAALWNATTLP